MIGTLTRLRDHFLASTGPGGGVQACIGATPKLKAILEKELTASTVDDAVADLFYTSAFLFNVARNPHFRNAVQKIAEFGKGYTPPGSQAIRTNLLQRSKDRVTKKLADVKATWKETGCTILSDGWSDMCQRPLINVLVSCPEGVVFF
ncbi:hypothetical protein SUGI_0372920 [Cryptomeria japonica]|nr:hypothetical protein SUGI_0372920 [Cryptomeria japonica]